MKFYSISRSRGAQSAAEMSQVKNRWEIERVNLESAQYPSLNLI